MPRLFRYLQPVVLLSALGLSCGRCGGRSPIPFQLEALLPAAPAAVVVVRSLAELSSHATSLAAALARFPEGEVAGESLGQLAQALGFDPRTAGGLSSAGIDGARTALVISEGPDLWFAIPVSAPDKFEKVVDRLARDHLGAKDPQRLGALELFSAPAGQAAALTFTAGYALLATGTRAQQLVSAALTRPPQQSLAAVPSYAAGLSRLGRWDVVAYLPAGSSWLPTSSWPGQATWAGLSFAQGRLSSRLLVMLSLAEGSMLSALALPAGQELLPFLAAGDPLVVRLGGDPALLSGYAASVLPVPLVQQLSAAGIDVGRDLLAGLKPGVTLGLGLSPKLDLSAASSFDPRRQNPFLYVKLHAFGRVLDPAQAPKILEKLYAAAPRFGAQVERRKIGTQEVATFSYELGEGASVALVGDTLVVTGGEGEMVAALGRLQSRGGRFQPSGALAGPLLGKVSDGLALDTDALRDEVDHIPTSAYSGFTGLTVHALIERFAAPLSQVGPLLVSLNVEPDAATANAEVTLR